MVDITNDKDLSFLAIAIETAPIKPLELLKTANVEEPFEEYSNDVFADPINKQFPIHTPEHTAISALYLFKQANEVDLDTKERVKDALNEWGISDLSVLLDGEQPLTKMASSDLYLMPSKNKFPVYDVEGLTKVASVVGGYLNTMSVSDRVEVSSNLIKTAEEFGVSLEEIPQWALVYGQALSSDLHKTAEAISVRHAITNHDGYKNILTKIAKLKNKVGDISYDPEINRGIAFEMMELDKVAGVTYEDVPDVFISVFNSTKQKEKDESVLSKIASEEGVVIGDTEFYKSDVIDFIENNNAVDVFGEDLCKEASNNGNIDAEYLLQNVCDLPYEAQVVIAEGLKDK